MCHSTRLDDYDDGTDHLEGTTDMRVGGTFDVGSGRQGNAAGDPEALRGASQTLKDMDALIQALQERRKNGEQQGAHSIRHSAGV